MLPRFFFGLQISKEKIQCLDHQASFLIQWIFKTGARLVSYKSFSFRQSVCCVYVCVHALEAINNYWRDFDFK